MESITTPHWWSASRTQKETWDWKELLEESAEGFYELFRAAKVQNPSCIKFLRVCLQLAWDIIDERGNVTLVKVQEARGFFNQRICPLKPGASGEYYRMVHIDRILSFLQNSDIRLQFEKTKRGLGFYSIDKALLKTLHILPQSQALSSSELTDRHAKVALLSAWLFYLRQSVGSCFATAPAILVHTRQPERFLQDMQQILLSGSLKRVFNGKEVMVPAADDGGGADLDKPVMLTQQSLLSPGLLWSLASCSVVTLSTSFSKDIQVFASSISSLATDLLGQSDAISSRRLLRSLVCSHYGLEPLAFDEKAKNNARSSSELTLTVSLENSKSAFELCQSSLEKAYEAFYNLTDHNLLRIWEFTLASFSDTRQDFCQWSLQTSLGMNYDQPGSLAQCLYGVLQNKVEEYNQKSHEMQERCDSMSYQVQHALMRLQNANKDSEMVWLKADYQNFNSELEQLQSERDQYNQKAHAFANLYNRLLERYIELFGQYFQQVYDPQMRPVQAGQFDDTPAGFRLVFKAGRSKVASWLPIYSSQQFVDAIARFLIITEQQMLENEALNLIQDDFSHIVTLLVQHIRSREFLQSATQRMAQSLSVQVDTSSDQALERAQAAPWAYVSGGTMRSLLSHYYGTEQDANQRQSWFHDIQELWAFLIDTMRDMPANQSEMFLKDFQTPLLMHSACHAFLLLPGHPQFAPCWLSKTYPYTWIRDHYVVPVRDSYSACLMDKQAQELVLEKLNAATHIPWKFQPSYGSRLRPHEFRKECLKAMQSHWNGPSWLLKELTDQLDALLLCCLPILDKATLERRLYDFADQAALPGVNNSLFRPHIEQALAHVGPNASADEVEHIVLGALSGYYKCSYGPGLSPLLIRQEMAKFGLYVPLPIFFADTNWDHYQFAFVLNPGSDQLELWRMEPDSFRGLPMSEWKSQFSESAANMKWAIFDRPQEYGLFN